MLLIALVLVFLPRIRVGEPDQNSATVDTQFLGGVVLLVLLALELSDRVTMKRDLEIAREIQSWLMPSEAPKVPGVDIAFASRPANTVAGDYYDAFFRPNERLLLVVADVAGKSIPAALLTATLQASLRTLAALPGTLPELVERVNRYSCEQSLQGRRFTTAFLAELEPATGAADLRQRRSQLARASARLRRHRAPRSRRPAARHHFFRPLSVRHHHPRHRRSSSDLHRRPGRSRGREGTRVR